MLWTCIKEVLWAASTLFGYLFRALALVFILVSVLPSPFGLIVLAFMATIFF